MYILGIETSCDETAAAVIKGDRGNIKVLSNVVSSQIDIHKKYGGVVPEVAAREHVTQILPVIHETLETAGIQAPLSRDARSGGGAGGGGIQAIAVTIGPGLITSLIVGIETAKVLSYAWDIPVIGINHIEGHIYANFVGRRQPACAGRSSDFPALILTVSGGHTMLVLIENHGKYKTIGETRDDAAGEAFDKAASLLNLGYPGGPIISKYAEKYKLQITNPTCADRRQSAITLPRPMLDKGGFDFSFSGLKTALLYAIQQDKNFKKRVPEYAHEFQQAIIDVLIHKTIQAAQKYNIKTVMLSGGVAANTELRKQLKSAVKKQIPKSQFLIPDLKYTTDNAAMIATAGYYHALWKDYTDWQKLKVNCNLEL